MLINGDGLLHRVNLVGVHHMQHGGAMSNDLLVLRGMFTVVHDTVVAMGLFVSVVYMRV